MSIILEYPQVQVRYIKEQAQTANYLRVKSSYDFYGMSRPTWNEFEKPLPLRMEVEGLPDVWRVEPRDSKGKTDRISLDEDKQHWLLKINLEMYRGEEYTRDEYFAWFKDVSTSEKLRQRDLMVNWLTSAMTKFRSHTNDFGMDNMANYLKGERLDHDKPKFAQLVTGWYTAQPVYENGQVVKRNIAGHGECYGFKCISAKEDYWQYSPLREWWFFDMPLITGRVLGKDKSGGFIVRDDLHKPYPQFGGSLVFPVWLPQDNLAFISTGLVTLEMEGKLQKDWVV